MQPLHCLFTSGTLKQSDDSPHSCELPRSSSYRIAAPTDTTPLLPKDCSEQSLAFGLLLSVGTLGNRCNLARLLAASTAHDLV